MNAGEIPEVGALVGIAGYGLGTSPTFGIMLGCTVINGDHDRVYFALLSEGRIKHIYYPYCSAL